jgi:HKD family nuclease
MPEINLLKGDWSSNLSDLLRSARTEIVISSPFVSHDGAHFVLDRVSPVFQANGRLIFVTNLSPTNLIQGVTDPNALHDLVSHLSQTEVFHLPRLHAKTYISDTNKAIITSGNLTFSGLKQNYEYGVLITDPDAISKARGDIVGYAQLGAKISQEELKTYCMAIDEAKTAFRRQQASISHAAQQHFERSLQAASDELIRLRLAEGPIHTVFEKTVLFLLEQRGPLSTEELYLLVEQIHPDLCDNTVDRVIDGKRYGKKWKHALRTSQQQLKRKDLIILEKGKWWTVKNIN